MSKQLMGELEAQVEGLPILAPSWRKHSDQNKEEVTTAGWGSLGWKRVGARWAWPMGAPHPVGGAAGAQIGSKGQQGCGSVPGTSLSPPSLEREVLLEAGWQAPQLAASAGPGGAEPDVSSFERSLPDPEWLTCGRGSWRWLYQLRVSLRSNPEPTP